MTTTTRGRPLERQGPAHAAPLVGTPLTGVGALVRLNLRLDRVRLVVWILAIGVGVWASVAALEAAYPDGKSLASRAALLTNPSAIMMTGPGFALDNYTFGAMVANELSLYVCIAAAIMSILLAVRHTRGDEEAGRLELIVSLPVGRFAPPMASIVTVGIANVAVGAAVTIGLLLPGLEAASSLAFGLATALTGIVFAAVAALAAQLTEHARTATGTAMAVLAGAFLVRGAGDVIDHQGSWLSWFSPFAWAQQTRLYVDLRWWPLAVSLGIALLMTAIALALARRRDLGAGLVPPRLGRPIASAALRAPGGLATRLLRGSAVAWAIGTLFFAIAMGSLANSIETMLAENPAIAEWVAIGGLDPAGDFAALILSFVLIAPLILGVGGVLRLTSEEQAGRIEQLLAASHSRAGLLMAWLAAVAVQVAALTVLVGVGTGLGVAAGTGEARWVGEMTVASLVYLPAVMLVVAVAAALYGLLPRFTIVAWLFVVWISMVLFLGELLGLPDWATGISPFSHTPALPGDGLDPVPLLIMGAIVTVLTALAVIGFRRRDIPFG